MRPMVLTLEMFLSRGLARVPEIRRFESCEALRIEVFSLPGWGSWVLFLFFSFFPRTASSFHICACSDVHLDHFDHSCYSFLLFIQFFYTDLSSRACVWVGGEEEEEEESSQNKDFQDFQTGGEVVLPVN